jgi:DNA polymerase-3 subunit delta'
MAFKEVIGQQQVKQHLAEMVNQNRLSHALLFLGKEGVGALPLAIAFAQYIVCEKVNNKAAQSGASLFGEELPPAEMLYDACGVCTACRKAAELVHPDIHFSYPVIPKKAGDKPISTDFITEWREFVSQSPYGNVYDWLQFIGAENKQGNITAQECNEIIHTRC